MSNDSNGYVDKRMRYFDRQFLRAGDLEDEQSYHMARRRNHRKAFCKAGVVHGLVVELASRKPRQITVGAGWALDKQGRAMVLPQATDPISVSRGPKKVYMVYAEHGSDPSEDPGINGDTRVHEEAKIVVVDDGDRPPKWGVLVATLSAKNVIGPGDSAGLPDDSVTSDAIADDAVGPDQIADDAVESQHVAEASGTGQNTNAGTGIKTGHIQDGAITKGKIRARAVTADKIDSHAVESRHIAEASASLSVGTDQQDTNQGTGVKTGHIQDNAVTTAKIAANAVGSSELAGNAVETEHIEDEAVTRVKLKLDRDLVGDLVLAPGACVTELLDNERLEEGEVLYFPVVTRLEAVGTLGTQVEVEAAIVYVDESMSKEKPRVAVRLTNHGTAEALVRWRVFKLS